VIIELRHDTPEAWAAANPVLDAGEIGIEDGPVGSPSLLKIGDGVTHWIDLAYATGGTGVTLVIGDARYVKKPTTGNVNDVLTKTGTDTSEWRAPSVPFASTNW
jgi:hypothetical protein